ncbi:MAG: metallophosphoesterase [Pseudomonadales bacterium]|jgi:uncharacterized protein (TIGR04168 family)|tara:strand:- start:51 stop:932 length:882 start_codon:yes stop_codon:yes gene_type:complete
MTNLIRANGDTFRLGIVGDLHSHFDTFDVHQFNALAYDLLFFTGDLGGGTRESSLMMARMLANLRGSVLVMPGNNDTVDIQQLAAELTHRQGLGRIMAITQQSTESADIALCGYSLHRIVVSDRRVTLLAARPHSMGGPDLTFPDYMAKTYSIHSLEDSEARIRRLVDEADEEIIFLAHNGPLGLGDGPQDIWGCDFKPDGGDWGDPDLATAVAYAKSVNKRVLAVIAGHMHLRTKQGLERPWKVLDDGIVYVNAARVPRIFNGSDDVYRHHIQLHIGVDSLSVEERLLPQDA